MTYFARHPIRCLFLFLSCLALFCSSGCATSKQASSNSFCYDLGGTVTSLDPQTATGSAATLVLGSIFEGLCKVDAQNRPIPGVAKAWISDANHTQYVFFLREDALWSNGEPVTASDFVFALRRALDPTTKATNIDELFILKNARDIRDGILPVEDLGVVAVNDHILKIYLEYADPDFPATTATPRYMPCNQAFFLETSGRYGLEAGYLLTNGPFCFTSDYSWENGVSIGLSRNQYYYGEVLPASLTFSLEGNASLDSLLAGDLDCIITDKSTAAKASEQGCTVYSFESGTTGLLLNTSDSLLEMVELRELFVKTIGRSALLQNLPEGVEEASDIMPSCIMWGDEPYEQVAQRGLLVAEDDSVTDKISTIAGSLESDSIPTLTVICPDDQFSIELVNRMIASWNEKIGSYFNILPLDPDSYAQKISAGDYQMALYTATASGNSPASFLRIFESTASPRLLNSSAYDTLLHSADKSIEDYLGLEKMLNNQYIFYPVVKSSSYYAVAPTVTGLSVGVSGIDFTQANK